MKVISSVDEIQQTIAKEKADGKKIGLVPSMGFLHEGHLSLIRQARENNDIVVLSIFVNPLQFGPGEDFDQYPRDLEKDQSLAYENGVDIVFCPSTDEMYPNEPTVEVTVKKRSDVLCGKSRPGHFDGVATVLVKLFHLTMPDTAYFGEKDAQQVAVVKGMSEDFNFAVNIEACPTVREEDGLAKSSRNVNLTPVERNQAPSIYQSLLLGKNKIEAGFDQPDAIKHAVFSHIEKHAPLGEVDYVELLTYPELEEIHSLKGNIIIAAAVRFSASRLIDNVIFKM